MSADYWHSTQRARWTFTKDTLVERRKKSEGGVERYARIRLFLSDQISALGTRLKMRQRVVATAQMFLSRVLTKIALDDMNIYLLMTTCLYIAGRAEEQPYHMHTVCAEARHQWPQYLAIEAWQLAECEFYVMDELETCLIVHHAYDPLMLLEKQLGLARDEVQASWAAINDSYATDIPLIYPPHIIALTAVYIVLVLKPSFNPTRLPDAVKKRLDSLAQYMGSRKTLDLRALVGCIQEFLSHYALRKIYEPAKVADEVKKLL